MMHRGWRAAGIIAALVMGCGPLAAQVQDTTEIARLKAQVEAITRELEELRLGRELVVPADTSVLGFGPAASKVYKTGQGVSIGGYGEVMYERFAATREDGAPSGRTDQLDALRAIVYVGYRFTDRVLFNSEIEIEHANTEQAGGVSLEFAYLDFRLTPQFGVRAGLLLPPMGLLNELHEPPVFLGSARPETERQIIPSTWRENGVGVFGEAGRFTYRVYLINGFDAVGGGPSRAEGFEASGLRDGRQGGSKAVAEDFAGVGRLEVAAAPGLRLGVSGYLGNSGQHAPDPSAPGRTIGARTGIWEGHVEYRARGFDLRGLFAMANVDDAAAINMARGLSGSASVGERLVGWYLQGGYDVLRHVRTSHQLVPYLRYEALNTQDRVPAGFSADPANDRRIVTLGAAWKPISNIALKADYQVERNAADTGVDRFHVNLSYLF